MTRQPYYFVAIQEKRKVPVGIPPTSDMQKLFLITIDHLRMKHDIQK